MKKYLDDLSKDPEDQNALEMIERINQTRQKSSEQEKDPDWLRDNLEADLRCADWIAEKCANKDYARALYAALCNNEFIKNDVWPLLKDERWSCSWRYAGGIIANIREEGDYIDWYCSGNESLVTDEIKQDLFKLGWLVCDSDNREE